MNKLNPNSPLIALTFDDGPNTTTTKNILEVLEKHKVLASFFVVGNMINDESVKVMKKAFDSGHDIQNHSMTHTNMQDLSFVDIKTEIERTSELIKSVTGYSPRFFRPPYIALSDDVYNATNLTFICGNGAEDWVDSVSTEQRAERIISQAKDGEIILLHDFKGNEQTTQALDIIIPKLLGKGYEFVTITQLFDYKNIRPKVRFIYSNVYD